MRITENSRKMYPAYMQNLWKIKHVSIFKNKALSGIFFYNKLSKRSWYSFSSLLKFTSLIQTDFSVGLYRYFQSVPFRFPSINTWIETFGGLVSNF